MQAARLPLQLMQAARLPLQLMRAARLPPHLPLLAAHVLEIEGRGHLLFHEINDPDHDRGVAGLGGRSGKSSIRIERHTRRRLGFENSEAVGRSAARGLELGCVRSADGEGRYAFGQEG